MSVGFLYGECPTVFWEHRVVHIDGHDITSIDLPRWNLDARHTYAPNQGIVYMYVVDPFSIPLCCSTQNLFLFLMNHPLALLMSALSAVKLWHPDCVREPFLLLSSVAKGNSSSLNVFY